MVFLTFSGVIDFHSSGDFERELTCVVWLLWFYHYGGIVVLYRSPG